MRRANTLSCTNSQAKLALWKQRFARFNRREQTVEAFCSEAGCSAATFYYWKHRLEAELRSETAETRTKPSAFVPVMVRGGSVSPVTVRLADGTRVSVPVDALAALEVVLQHAQRAAR